MPADISQGYAFIAIMAHAFCNKGKRTNPSCILSKRIMATVKIEGMACQHCEARVKKFLEELPGVSEAKADRIKKEAEFTIAESAVLTDEAIMEAVKKAGFNPIEVIR